MGKIRVLNGQIHPADVLRHVNDLFDGKWEDPVHQRFKDKAGSLGYKVIEYAGRYNYFGPAVEVEDHETFLQFLKNMGKGIKMRWDSIGKTGVIIYPD
jgi:hypothetical protein